MDRSNSYPQYRNYFGFDLKADTPDLSMLYIPSVTLLDRFLPAPFLISKLCIEISKRTLTHCHYLLQDVALRRASHHHWDCYSSYRHESCCVHDRSVFSGLWSRDIGYGWSSICLRDCPSCLPGCHDRSLQCTVVRRWYLLFPELGKPVILRGL